MPDSLLPTVTGPEDYRPWLGRGDVWLPVMQGLCRRHGLPEGALRQIAGGSAICFVAGKAVIKLQPPFWSEKLGLEQLGLERAQGRLSVRTPEVLASDRVEGWGYLILGRLPGVAITELERDLALNEQLALALQLGELMCELQGLDPEGLPREQPEALAGQPRSFFETQLGLGMPAARVEPFAGLLAAALPSLPAAPEAVFVHGDLSPENLLLETVNGRLRIGGLLDFGNLLAGCGLYEFAAPLAMICPYRPGLRRALIQGYGRPVSEAQLLAVLLHRFSHLPYLLKMLKPPVTPEAFRECFCSLG